FPTRRSSDLVAGDVVAVVEFFPVAGDVTIVVAPDGAQHGGPWLADHEGSTRLGSFHRVATVIDDVCIDAGKRLRARARRGGRYPRQWRDEDGSGLCLPPGVDDRAAAVADGALVPGPGFRVGSLRAQ